MSQQFILRICYSKGARVALLSHLETIHAVERMIRRANLSYAMTKGFNPHMKISFGLALPVGASSEAEYVDVCLKEFMPPNNILECLKAVASRDIVPVSCKYISKKATSAAAAYPVSDWSVRVEGLALEELQTALDSLLEKGYIMVKRRRKKARKVEFAQKLIDKPQLRKLNETNDVVGMSQDAIENAHKPQQNTLHNVSSKQNGCVEPRIEMRFQTRACADGTLRPDCFAAAVLEGCDNARIVSIKRLAQRVD